MGLYQNRQIRARRAAVRKGSGRAERIGLLQPRDEVLLQISRRCDDNRSPTQLFIASGRTPAWCLLTRQPGFTRLLGSRPGTNRCRSTWSRPLRMIARAPTRSNEQRFQTYALPERTGFCIAVGRRYYRRMRHPPHQDLATTARWTDLVDEFNRWTEAGRVATLWWRDDDAVAESDRLNRLVSIASDVPISLAVIPAAADSGLAAWLTCPSRSPRFAVLQHGWCHVSHAVDRKKSEFSPERSRQAVASDLAAGRARLTALFGTRALAVLVPPWNRLASCFLSLLPACGLGAISRVKPRRTPWPAPGIAEVNVHIDLVAWAEDRGFIGEEAALGGIVRHLQARRLGEVDAQEPTGILTHHLVQDPATDEFLHRLVAITKGHPAARWLDAAEVFAGAFFPGR